MDGVNLDVGRIVARAIAQGSSEYNVTILVDARESVRALRAVHARFYLATLPLALAVVGPGLIGATFLSQLEQQMQACTPGSRAVAHRAVGTYSKHDSCALCILLLLFAKATAAEAGARTYARQWCCPRADRSRARMTASCVCCTGLLETTMFLQTADDGYRLLGLQQMLR